MLGVYGPHSFMLTSPTKGKRGGGGRRREKEERREEEREEREGREGREERRRDCDAGCMVLILSC
jgi:hypothetical protein